MSNTKPTKKPLSAAKAALFSRPSFFGTKLDIPSDVKKDISERGLEYRWVDYNKYTTNGNMHENGWEPYRRTTKPTGTEALTFGSSPDGIIRRASLMLAVRPKKFGEEHRGWLKSKAAAASGHNKIKADELREMAGPVGATIHEGYEENEE
jgi:hypothetical protein